MLEKLLSLFGRGRKYATLKVAVPPGRQGCGTIVVLGRDGKELLASPIMVAARADDSLARRHGNPARDVMRPYGDPPCGTYLLVAIDRLEGAPEELRDELGGYQLLFEPSEGDAAKAEAAGRLLLALHGGRAGADDRIRAGAGGLRVRDRDLEALLRALGSEAAWRLELHEERARLLPPAVSSEPAGIAVYPPIPYSTEAKRAIERRQSSADGDHDSWRYRHDDDWRSSSRDTYSSSGAAVAGAAGAAVAGAAAAQGAQPASDSGTWHGGSVASAESGSTDSGAWHGGSPDSASDTSGSPDSASGTSY